MIILPDKNIVRTKFLVPVPESSWRTPSQAQYKDQFGNENKTVFIITAILNDGHGVWHGIFESRSDFDAFLWAIKTKKLKTHKELWSLPTPAWTPDVGTELTYEFATATRLTTPTGSLQTYNVPIDWNNNSNVIQCIGGGGSGGWSGAVGQRLATGGGGGAYSRAINQTLAQGTTSYQIGTGGASRTTAGAGTAGGNTWFGGTTQAASKCGANGGSGGNFSNSQTTLAGGAGGTVTGAIGSVTFAGGAGGAMTSTAVASVATGGGGAAGYTANGSAGVSTASDAPTAGGAGSGGAGGTGGTGAVGAGAQAGGTGVDLTGNLFLYAVIAGSGGGGGGDRGADAIDNSSSGAGGIYGGGSGAVTKNTGFGGTMTASAGGNGVVVVSYQSNGALGGNMPLCF